MKFNAAINIMPLKELLDPQGKTVQKNMANIGINNISGIRIGKHITIEVEANDENEAKATVDEACKKMFANLIMESYEFELTPA